MPKQIGDLKLYDLKELSEILGITVVSLRNYLRSKKIRGRKMGRNWYVTQEALEEYLKKL